MTTSSLWRRRDAGWLAWLTALSIPDTARLDRAGGVLYERARARLEPDLQPASPPGSG